MLHKLVAEVGFEPTYTAYETVELPLLYPAIEIGRYGRARTVLSRFSVLRFTIKASYRFGAP